MADEETTRHPALKALERFLGVWNTTGEIEANGDEPAGVLTATDRYEWLPGKHFMLHTVDARMNGEPHRSIEIIGYDAERNSCVARSYDDGGATDEFLCALEGRSWRIVGETMRFSGAFAADDRTMSGAWELQDAEGEWARWMEITLTRAD